MSRPRILVIGHQGQVGWELTRTLATLGEVVAVGRDSQPYQLDLTRPERITALLQAVQPRWIVNAAAYTAVDNAQKEPDLTHQVNALAVERLAREARSLGAMLVHYSTDYVFDGESDRPYLETDLPNPQSVYGRSKLAGEQAIQAVGGDHLILRTCWVYGNRGHNFMRTIRRLAREREALRIVADQRGSPTWSRHIAEATAQILARLDGNRESWAHHSGIYHLASAGECSWHDFAERIVAHQRDSEGVKTRYIAPITTEEYPLPAPRPRYSVLDTGKLRQVFGIHMPDWTEALAQVQDELDNPIAI